MHIELLSAVRRASPNDMSPPHQGTWPQPAGVTASAWVEPGDQVCVYLLKLHGAKDQVELPWGRVDDATDELDFTAWAEGKSFARACLIPAGELRQKCDAGDVRGTVTYKPTYPGSFAGFWVPAKPHLYQPVAFMLLTAPAGPDLAPYCERQPIFISAENADEWLNPKVNTVRFQHEPPRGTFTVLGVEEVEPAMA
ncbi:MAG: hypothetical protein JO335_05490 [Sphingomonas sp.]|nr:hypothetical protein [Sphingomonas sp.]